MVRVALSFLFVLAPVQAFAQVHAMPASVPTLDEVGLIGLGALVALVAGWAIKRKK